MSAKAEYSKLASNIVFSSLWNMDSDTCKIWVTLLALKDLDGIVDKNITGIQRLTGIPLEKCEEAIHFFQQPDPQSTSKIKEGRRLEVLEDGRMLVINHGKYMELGWSEEKRRVERNKKQRYRDNLKTQKSPPPQTEPESLTSKSHFQKPTHDDLTTSGLSPLEAEKFINYYDSCGWVIGKNKPMKDWKSAARGWLGRSGQYQNNSSGTAEKELTDAEILKIAMQ